MLPKQRRARVFYNFIDNKTMEEYFNYIIKKSQSNNDHEDDIVDSITDVEESPLPSIEGGKNISTIHIIYSFIIPIFQLIHNGAPDLKIYDTSIDLKRIIKKVHSELENKFITSNIISERIINQLVSLIIGKAKDHNFIFIPVGSKSAPFDLTPFFDQLCMKDKTHRYLLKFINPDFDLLLQQVIDNYTNTHHRLTLNSDIIHILKHYSQTSQETSHAITFDPSTIDKTFNHISSAFTDSDDKSAFIDLFVHRLNPNSPPSYSVIHTFAAHPSKAIRIIDVSSSSLKQDSFGKVLSLIVDPSAPR